MFTAGNTAGLQGEAYSKKAGTFAAGARGDLGVEVGARVAGAADDPGAAVALALRRRTRAVLRPRRVALAREARQRAFRLVVVLLNITITQLAATYITRRRLAWNDL